MNSPVSREHLAALSHKQLCRLYKRKQRGVLVKSIPAEEAKVVDRLLQLDDPVRYCEIHSQKDLIQFSTVSSPNLTPDSSWNKDRLLASLGIIQDTPTNRQTDAVTAEGRPKAKKRSALLPDADSAAAEDPVTPSQPATKRPCLPQGDLDAKPVMTGLWTGLNTSAIAPEKQKKKVVAERRASKKAPQAQPQAVAVKAEGCPKARKRTRAAPMEADIDPVTPDHPVSKQPRLTQGDHDAKPVMTGPWTKRTRVTEE